MSSRCSVVGFVSLVTSISVTGTLSAAVITVAPSLELQHFHSYDEQTNVEVLTSNSSPLDLTARYVRTIRRVGSPPVFEYEYWEFEYPYLEFSFPTLPVGSLISQATLVLNETVDLTTAAKPAVLSYIDGYPNGVHPYVTDTTWGSIGNGSVGVKSIDITSAVVSAYATYGPIPGYGVNFAFAIDATLEYSIASNFGPNPSLGPRVVLTYAVPETSSIGFIGIGLGALILFLLRIQFLRTPGSVSN